MLKTNFLGLELENPVIVAAGPWNRDGASLHESIAAGAGAVVTESIRGSPVMRMARRTFACTAISRSKDGNGRSRSLKLTEAS